MKERWKEELYEIADLERARLLLYPQQNSSAAELVAAALAAARRAEAAHASFMEAYGLAQKHQCEAGYLRGAAEMRERAAAATTFCCFECSRVIRALPLTPEENA